jgi:hypothetical protein
MAKRVLYNTVTGDNSIVNAGSEVYPKESFKFPETLKPIRGEYFDEYGGDPYRSLKLYNVGESRFDSGLTYLDEPYLQNIRASRQGPIAQFGSFLNQAIVGELIGGTIEGIGYLGEINEFSDLMSGEDEEFGNAVSRFGKSIREWAREATPVYEYDYREGDFRPWDWSWWMSNGPSIASSLSLMIPSGAVAAIPARLAKSLTFAGKYSAAIRAGRTAAEAAQIASKASTNVSRTVAGLTQAVTSRKMEALMESNGTYDESYQMAISSGKSEDEARQIAAKAAKNNYIANWAMLVQDVPQYLFLNKYIGKYLRGEADDAVKGMSVAAKNELGQKVSLKDYIPSLKASYTLGKDMLGEAGEEAYQYLSNQYGLYSAERMINPDMDVSFIPWAKENIDIGEMATNAFFGAIGAGFMQGVGRPLMDKVRGVEDTQVLEIRSIAERYATIGKNILNAQKIGDDHKLAMELSKGGAELGIRAAMGNSKELLDSFINLVDSGDFSTASKDLQAFAETEEGKSIITQDKKNASEIKKYAEEAYNLYNETLRDINQEGHTFNKGYKKALENLKKTGRSIDADWYKKALASVMTSTSIGKSIIDNSIKNIEQELENSKDKYEKSANQAFKDLSLTGKGILFNELELEALQNIINKDNIIHNEDVMKQMPTKTKEDIDNWRKSIKKEIERLEKTIQNLKDNYPDDDKTNDSSIKVNKADLLEYKELSNKLSLIKRDSYIFGQALKRYNNGELLSDKDIEKYSKEFEDRQEEEYKNGLQIGDTVTIGQDGPLAIIDNVKFTDNKRKYVVKQFAVNEDGSVDESNTLEEYDEDDIWLYDNSGKIDPSLVDTVSSTIDEKNNDPNAELRKSLHDKHLNDPLMTLSDMVSMSHIEQSNPNEIIQRDPKLNSLLSTPLSAVDSIEQSLKDGRVEYSLDLSDKQKFWETHQDLKKRILSIKGNKRLSNKVKTQRINKLISDLIDQVTDNNFNHIIDTIPIKLTVVLKNEDSEQRFDGTDQFNLYVHNSDFWNLDAPASIYMEQGVEAAEEYILHQRQKTRAFRVTLLEKLLAADIAIGKGLKRYGGHLNRVATHGAIHERLGEELKDVDLWIGIQDSAGTTSPFMESGVVGMWSTQPGAVLFRTNKTLDGSDIFVHATVSNLSKEHAEILWDSYLIIAAGFGYSAKLNRDNVKNATVGEILDLLVAQGEKVSNNMKDKNQVLYLKGRKELHFGDQVIKDISKATASQRGKFIKWASESKKYRVPFEVTKLGFKLNSLYKNKSGIQIGSFEIKPGDTRTWAQMLMSTPISSGKGGARYAVSTNVERVLDEETGSFKETVIHSPALKVLDTDLDSFDKSNDQSENDTPVAPEIPTPTVENINDILGSGIVIGEDDTVTGFYRSEQVDEETEKISETELTWLKDRLKSGSTIEMSDRFLEIIVDGESKQAYGVFKSSAIYLYSNAPKGTVYHEAFHRVSLGYLSDIERKQFYNAARKKYNIPDASDSQVEERLAEEFRAWRNYMEVKNGEEPTSIFDWVKNLFNFIKHYFTGKNAIANYELDTLFKLIDRGAFKYHKIKRSRIKELEGLSAPLEISSIGDGMVNVPFVNSRVDFDDFIKGLAHILIVENGVNDLADIKGMNFNKMFAYINNKLIPDLEKKLSKLRAYHKTGNFTQDITEEKLLIEIFSHERALSLYKSMGDPKYMKIYKTHLKKVLKTEYSINNIENNSEELLSEDDEETMSPQELITRYSKESFELNIVDNVTSNVKFLIATLPRSSEVNPITRTVKFVKFHDTWYELLFHLHDLDSIEDMMAKLKELGEQHHHFNILYKRLERRSPNLRNQFKTAVNKHKHMFINFTYTSETGNRKKGSPIVYQIYRADINRAEEEEKYVWAENFIQSKYVSHGEKAGDIQKINVEALTALYEDYVMFENKVRKEGRKQLSPEELNEYAETLLQFLHNVGIPIDRLTLDAYVQSKVKQVGKKIYGPREVLYSLITTEFSASNPRDDNQVGYFYKLKQLAELGLQREEDIKKYNELKSKKSKNIPTLPLYDLDANIRSIYTTRDSLYIIRELARKMFEVHPDLLNDVVIGPNGHQYFTYALNTYTTDTIKKLKDKSFIDKKLSKIGNKHSLFLQQLSESDIVREKISIRTMSSFQERDTNDSGSSYSDLNTIEDYILRLGALHNKETLVPFPIIADRSTYYFLDGLSLPRNIYELNPETGELEFTNEIIDIFVGYAEDERERIKEAKDIIKAYNDAEKRNDGSHIDILKNKMILNYHYKLKGNKIITAGANALKYIDFKEFNNKDFNFERDARNLIKEHLAKVVAFGLNRAKKLKVYEVGIEEENNQEYIKNILIDNQIYKEYLSLFPNSSHAMQAILAFNEIGMIISNFEINKLFVGDPAFFKGDKEESIQQDRIKRLMVLTSSGDAINQKTIEKNIVDDHFTMAALTTQKLNMSSPEYREYDPSNYYYTLRNLLIVRYSQMLVREMKHKRDPLYGELKYILDEEYLRSKDGILEFDIEKVNNIEKSVLREIFGVDINDILESYRSVDSTDGQAYVSPSMFRAMLIQLGEWPEWKEAAYNNIMSRKDWYSMTKEEQDAVLKLYMQPLKPVFFDLVDNGNIEVPTYLKMSVMPLFPGLVDNMKLRDLADRMEAVGKYSGLGKIDMVPYDSAIKVGLGYSVPLYKDQYKEDVSDLSDMSSTRLPFRSLRKQLVTDPHNITETKLGTQVIKITLSDLILDESVYNIPGIDSPITGKELAEVIFSSLASVSNKGLKRFKEKIGFDDKTNQINLKKLAETLREDAIKSNMPDLISDAFRTEGDNLYLELDTFSNRKQIFSRLIGMVTKHTIDIKMPGNQFIQLSATGINVSNSSNLAWYALDANGNVSAAECAISISLFKHLIPNYSTQSFKESADYVLNHIPELLVYRIPTQGQSSAMYLKVSRLLPEQVGDTIILPKAVTSLTGSDFDIDKMFVVRHSYFINDSGKMEKVKFYDKEEDGKSPQELAFDNQQSYIVSKYKEDIKQLESKLFDPSVQQEDKINSVIEFTESLKEAIPESLYNSLQTLLSDMMLSELDETFVGIDNIKNIANLLNNWNYQEAKKEFLEKYKDSSPYEFNSEQAVKNRLLDAYLSVYKNTNSIPQTQSPLGSYKKLLTTLAGSIKEEDGGNMFHTYSASNQNILKFEYTGGKDGIGPFALNNSHHVLSQIAGLKYIGQSFGLLNTDSKGSIDLSAKLSRDNTNIMAWLSALIDAHVDLAKDNYIMKLNVNAATYNFIAFMIRGGFGLNTFKITSQPIIRDLAERINNSGRYSRMGLYTSKKQALEATKKDWIKLLSDEAKKVYDERKFNNNSVYDFIHVTKALEKKYYNVKVEELSGKEKDNFVLDQLMAFDIFEHFNKMGEDLNNFVQICQVDTKKFGRNVPEIIQYQKRVLDFKEANRFENANRLFPTAPRQIKDGESLLGPYYRNSVLFLLQMMPNLTIYSSPGFIDIVNTVLNLSGNGSTLNKKLVNNIADEVFAAIAGDFFFDVDEDGNPEENSFGLKTHHVANIMQGVIDTLTRIKYSDEPIAKRFRDNPIFSLLLKRPLSEDKGLPFTSYIAVVRKAFSDTASINDYMYGILDLLSATPKDESEVEMIKEIHKFARSLFVYSFLNSGFRNKLHSFFNVIPPVLYKNLETANGRKLSYNDFIKAKKELFSSDINTALSVYVDRVFKNNWMNKQIVTPIIDDHVAELADPFLRDIQYPIKDKKTGDIIYKWRRAYNVKGITPPIKAMVLSYNKEGNVIYQRYYLGDNAEGEPVFKKYIVYREERYDRVDTNNEPIQSFRPYLLEYVGYLIDSSEEEKKIHPVYKTVTRDSYEKSGIVVKTPGLTPGSIIKDANEEGLLIQDGEELQYFNDESIQSQVNGYEFVPVTNLVVMTSLEKKRVEQEGVTRDTNKSERTTTVESTTPEFDKLPYRSIKKTMTYAGIGSRQTPPEILSQMTDIAKELESKGYTLRTGDAKGADKSFREGTGNSEIYRADDATDVTRAIAKEIHPNPDALTDYALDLMARNTNQVFGENLDTPVDFVLYYAEPSNNPIRPQGGTGQAVEMANRKGIPTINMMDKDWRNKLNIVIGEIKTSTESKKTTEEILVDLKNNPKEYFIFDEEGSIALRYSHTEEVDRLEERVVDVFEGYPEVSIEEIKKGDYYIYSDFGRDQEIFETEARRMLDNFLQNNKIPVYIETWSDLRDKLNEKFKNSPNFTPLTLNDIINATSEQITNWKNCL